MTTAARKFFDASLSNPDFITQFTDEPERVLEEVSEAYDGLIPDMPYVETPRHPMAGSMYFCALMLAIHLALRPRGVDVHTLGGAMLKMVADVNQQRPATAETEPGYSMIEASKASLEHAGENEFVFEVLESNDEDADWVMNVKSCAICSLYSKHDAMDLVPYMCASDDVVSDIAGQGLRRTGTIALGAHQCDFVFHKGGQGSHLSDQYPDRILVKTSG
jgi:hypothetical protein